MILSLSDFTFFYNQKSIYFRNIGLIKKSVSKFTFIFIVEFHEKIELDNRGEVSQICFDT